MKTRLTKPQQRLIANLQTKGQVHYLNGGGGASSTAPRCTTARCKAWLPLG